MNDFVLDSCNKLSSLDSLNQNEDLASINHQLYKLLQSTNIDIDYQIFRYLIYELNDCPLIIIICIIFFTYSVVLNLLRAGVCPEALFVFFSNIYPYTRIGRKLENIKKAKKLRKEQAKKQSHLDLKLDKEDKIG